MFITLSIEIPVMIKTVKRLNTKLRELTKNGETIDLSPLLFDAALEVFLRFNFGIDAEEFDQEGTKLRRGNTCDILFIFQH
jgi:hypothetical protein